jgi:proteasome accessory factor C
MLVANCSGVIDSENSCSMLRSISSAGPGSSAWSQECTHDAAWVAEYYPCESVTDADGGGLHVRMRVADRRWLRRLVLRLGGAAGVIDPADLADEVAADAQAALAAYAEAS